MNTKLDFKSPQLVFLGTGAAWSTPELGCPCGVCSEMRARGEHRTRTSLWFDGVQKLMIDCGPDAARQLEQNGLDRPDAVLISHEHGDHFLGLDELEVFRRRMPAGVFDPIPVFAHPEAWPALEARFGYLFGKLLTRNEVLPGRPFHLPRSDDPRITAFKTDHGPGPKGSVGYAVEFRFGKKWKKMIYTSDFKGLPDPEQDLLARPDYLIAQSHWFNEPQVNRPSHMSLQRLAGFVKLWRPVKGVFLVHISDADLLAEEKDGEYMKKSPPLDPWRDAAGELIPPPRCQEEWQRAAQNAFKVVGLDVPVTAAHDGLRIQL